MANRVPDSGVAKLSNLKSVFGGTNPVSLSKYYSNGEFVSGVVGIPSSGNVIRVSNFRGKSTVLQYADELLMTSPSQLRAALVTYLSELKNPDFYEYSLDGDAASIATGGNNMYAGSGGNFTKLMVASELSSNLEYSGQSAGNEIVLSSKTVEVVSLGNAAPMVYLAKCNARTVLGFSKSGTLGNGGVGVVTTENVFSNATVEGFTVHSWFRQVSGAASPTVCDVYFAIGDLSSTFHSTTMTTSSSTSMTSGSSSFSMDVSNVVMGTMLLAKAEGMQVTAPECRTIITAICSKLKASGYQRVVPLNLNFDLSMALVNNRPPNWSASGFTWNNATATTSTVAAVFRNETTQPPGLQNYIYYSSQRSPRQNALQTVSLPTSKSSYTLSFFVTSGDNGRDAFLGKADFKDSAGTIIQTIGITGLSVTPATWTKYTFTTTVDMSNATSVLLTFAGHDGEPWFGSISWGGFHGARITRMCVY